MLNAVLLCIVVTVSTSTCEDIKIKRQETTSTERLLTSTQSWFPGQVRLRSFGLDNFNGVLVGEGWVLTAASVFTNNYNPVMWGALVVAKDNSPGQTTLHVQNIFLYGGYKETSHRGDIALVKLQTSQNTIPDLNLQAQKRFAPVDLPVAGQLNQDQSCYLIGWKAPDNGVTRSQDLRITPVSLLNTTQCNQKAGSVSAFPGQLCLVHEGPCQGDQGSPVLCQHGNSWTVVGIVSHGVGCGEVTHTMPATLTDVTYYVPWINKVMAKF